MSKTCRKSYLSNFGICKSGTEIIKKELQKRVIKHFLDYDHFEYFNEKQQICENGNKCNHYLKVLNYLNSKKGADSIEFKDILHMQLYFHNPHVEHKLINTVVGIDSKSNAIFDYAKYKYDLGA